MVREIRNTADGSRAVAVAGRVVSAKSADFAEQGAGAGDDLCFAALGLQRKRAFLDRIGAIGDVAGGEQHLTRFEPVALRADGQDPQCRRPEPPENRNPLKERDIVLDRHSGRDLRDQLVAARFGDQDGWGSGIFLDLLP